MANKNVENVITGAQFTEIVHRATQATRHGDDPAKPAKKIIQSWYRLNTLAERQGSERDQRILADSLMIGSTVVQEAMSAAGSKGERRKHKLQQAGLKLDGVQMGLGNSQSDLSKMQQVTSEVIDSYGDIRTPRNDYEGHTKDLFLALNARALNIQVQTERARDISGARRSAIANVLQASLADLVQVSAGHLARFGTIHSEGIEAGDEVITTKYRGDAGELAFFARHLADWYDNGVMRGNYVRLASTREDAPHLLSQGKRLGFDAVVNTPDQSGISYAQVKTSKHLGGVGYVPEIDPWRPVDPDFMTSAVESAAWFSSVVGRSAVGSSVASAQHNINTVYGEPVQLRAA